MDEINLKKGEGIRIYRCESVDLYQVDNDIYNEENLQMIKVGQGKTLLEALEKFLSQV